MKRIIRLLILHVALTSVCLAQSETQRFLYMSTPDGAQKEGRSGAGIMIFDIDNGHRFVRRIDIPIFEEGLRGFTGNEKTHSVYYSTTNRRLGQFDVENEKTVWEQQYDAGCDRSSVTLDGKKLYVPTGWWYGGEDSGFLVVDGQTGELKKRIAVGAKAHNSIVSLDGKYAYLGTEMKLTMFDTRDDRIIKEIENVGEKGVFPYTVNSRNTIAYVCLGSHVGFDVVDLKAGKALHRVLAGKEPIANRTHGAALSPDEQELWISDQKGKRLFVFDATKMPPEPKTQLDLSQGGHGWITFSGDGRIAWNHTPDVFDAKTKLKIAEFRDESGNRVSSSKFIEIHFKDGKVVWMGSEFGLGRL
jgi:outer membrane protein assembly factor BamB